MADNRCRVFLDIVFSKTLQLSTQSKLCKIVDAPSNGWIFVFERQAYKGNAATIERIGCMDTNVVHRPVDVGHKAINVYMVQASETC